MFLRASGLFQFVGSELAVGQIGEAYERCLVETTIAGHTLRPPEAAVLVLVEEKRVDTGGLRPLLQVFSIHQ